MTTTTDIFDKTLKDIIDDIDYMLIEDHTEYSGDEELFVSSDSDSSLMDTDETNNNDPIKQNIFFSTHWDNVKNNNPNLSNKEIYGKVVDLWNKYKTTIEAK